MSFCFFVFYFCQNTGDGRSKLCLNSFCADTDWWCQVEETMEMCRELGLIKQRSVDIVGNHQWLCFAWLLCIYIIDSKDITKLVYSISFPLAALLWSIFFQALLHFQTHQVKLLMNSELIRASVSRSINHNWYSHWALLWAACNLISMD